ncbi:hypothetical protein J8L98_11040 [Pseudoalteromonas sp. MMG013]|uniref:hypothetical protein n=1 Tax=Pseudoalteromonas sp. MMG013 TaxID=2822687 RepID=UPI001B37A055|nr:hypothetical protein [Pseudoalteromonas sp. MMG013]MBQ4862222.1 hypothetical protein [Pseudoalteromonas sp. MMG013]
MQYLSHQDLTNLEVNWNLLIDKVSDACEAIYQEDYCQPIKPYVTFENSPNRIIAMPAHLGGEVDLAGIKWIASFPGNLELGIPRAQSVTILNDTKTGVPKSIINSSLVSAMRTAAVTGLVIREYFEAKPHRQQWDISILGFGVIAQHHLAMISALFADKVSSIRIYDPRGVDIASVPQNLASRVNAVSSWEEAFADADMIITATTSAKGYMHGKAKPGSLHLNVSLRDYDAQFRGQVNCMLVDKWEEICRQNTDVEYMYKAGLLNKEETTSLAELVCSKVFSTINDDDVVMLNPMGMAVFDIATGYYVCEASKQQGIGTILS